MVKKRSKVTSKSTNEIIRKNTNEKIFTKVRKNVRLLLSKIIFAPKLLSSLRMKLILSFLIPIVFIILLGVTSSQMAASGLESKYRDTAIQVVGKTAEYMNFGLRTVENSSQEYLSNINITQYFTYAYLDDSSPEIISKMNSFLSTFQHDIKIKTAVNELTSFMYILSDIDTAISNRSGFKPESGVYQKIMETDVGEKFKFNSSAVVWSGNNAVIDEALGTEGAEYAVRLIRKFRQYQAVLIIDIKAGAIQQIIDNTNLDDTGVLAFVTYDGKEFVKNNINEFRFSEQTYYQNALANDAAQGSEYVKVNGKSYLFMYSKIGNSGAMICALIPKATITGQADGIKRITVILVILACIVAVATGVIISTGIDKTIKSIISGLRKAAKGDLTVEFHTKRNDEFKTLIEEVQSTFTNMKDLIKQVNLLSANVEESSANVSQSSELFLKSAEDISHAITEIESGIMQQAKDAEQCLLQMDNLSKKIELVTDNTKQISYITDNAKKAIAEGTHCTQELNQQTQSTIEITTDIINVIESLAQKSATVTKITNIINEIVNQTNLLSLNASIEAARAGEHGKGFAVVASEIRNLAEKSKQSVNEIKKITGSIWSDTKTAAETAKKVEAVLALQENAVKNTTASYDHINESVEQLMINLGYISESVSNIEEARDSTLGAIENISAVLEEIAASSNSVSQTTTDQLNSVEALNKSAATLKENAGDLTQAVQRFTV
jgi:methyl-accepting chemotaxis protein